MNRTDKFQIFFILLALLFWNPFMFFLVYGNTSIYNSTYLKIFYWLIFAAGLLIIVLIKTQKLGTKVKNIFLFFSALGIFYSILVCFDFVLGAFAKPNEGENQGLIFEPNSEAKYSTPEFDFTAKINSIGLRDATVEINKSGKYRILCFGDSFTYGWGVELPNSWPKQLEKILHAKAINAEVINCGRTGQYTTTYKKYIKKAVPLLEPDLVLVGVQQLEDLAQLFEINYLVKEDSKKMISLNSAKYILKEYLRISFINILAFFTKKKISVDIKADWQSSVKKLKTELSHFQRRRYDILGDSVKKLFETGNLNPALLHSYINFPDESYVFNDPEHPATLYAINEMTNDFYEMKNTSSSNRCKLIFINLPTYEFTKHIVTVTPRDRVMTNYLSENNKIDSIYRAVASKVGLPYFELTDKFLSLEDKSAYFFKFDGHPNEKGYEEIAKHIAEYLINTQNNKKLNYGF